MKSVKGKMDARVGNNLFGRPHIGRLGMWKQEEKGGLTSALDVVVIRRDRIVIKDGFGEDLLDMLI